MGDGAAAGTSRVVVELAAEQTHDLRQRVLRVGTPSTDVAWAGDDLSTTLHLGVVDSDTTVVAISTWLESISPDVDRLDGPRHHGVQLRGMATDPAVRGQGVGALLLGAGIDRATQAGADHVWANARSAVLGFYATFGFLIVSDEFDSADTGIAHRRIVLPLPR